MSIKAKIAGLRSIRAQKRHKAQTAKAIDAEWWSIVRKILPPTVKEKHAWIELSDGTFMKLVVVGVPVYNRPGYPRSISPRLIGDLLNTSQVKCSIGFSFKIKPFSQADSNQALQGVEMRQL